MNKPFIMCKDKHFLESTSLFVNAFYVHNSVWNDSLLYERCELNLFLLHEHDVVMAMTSNLCNLPDFRGFVIYCRSIIFFPVSSFLIILNLKDWGSLLHRMEGYKNEQREGSL